MRLAIVTTTLQIGGAERLLQDLVHSWHENNRAIQPFCYVLEDGPLRPLLERHGCPVRIAPGGKTRVGPWIAPWLARRFRTDRIQVVHAHLPLGGFHARLAAAFRKLPLVYTEHSLWQSHSLGNRLLNRWTFSLNTRVVTVSDAVRQSILCGYKFPGRKLSVVPNGISKRVYEDKSHAKRQLGLPETAIVIGSIANLNSRKGLIFAIEALANALAQSPDIHLCIVGRDDGEGPKLRRGAAEQGISSRVHFLGYRPDARSLLAGFDVFTLPSLCEGQPIALLEAMDAGLPVVASAVGGIPEVVEHGITGFLVSPGDIEALARHFRTLTLGPELRASMGQAAREKVRRDHDIGKTADEYAGLYQALLPDAPRGT